MKSKKNNNNKIIKILIILMLMSVCAMAYIAWEQKTKIQTKDRNDSTAFLVRDIEQTCENLNNNTNEIISEFLMTEPVYSHRGSAGHNEHSFEAYDAAIEAGSHNIEQDVVVSKDGTLYVSHDLSAAEMTGTNRLYSDMTDSEIDKLTTKAGGKVLKLSDVFEKYDKSVHYLIELKSGDDATVNAFRNEVDKHGVENLVIVQALDIGLLDRLEEIYPDMPKLLVVKTASALQQALDGESVDIVGARVQFVNEENCREAHDRGKKFVGWTLDTEPEIKNAIDIGADAYFTNDTPLAIELEKKYRPVSIKNYSTLMFASDYQAEDGFDSPEENLRAVTHAAVSDGRRIDAAIFCGDYTNESGLHDYQLSPEESISEIRSVMREEVPQLTSNRMLFVQGNHDRLTESISKSGLHEYKNYLIYVLNTENDFPWKQGKVGESYEKVKASADAMRECFNGLIAEGETRPVFIAGHVPLHYTARTSSRHTTGDNLYSSLIFDVVNEAANSLDIIYMYGHNHSKGWDCYMGGASVFKRAGDTLLLPAPDGDSITTDSFEEKTLNFIYMNAGYVGYYKNCGPGENKDNYTAADETLSCTICEIYHDRIEIRRYDADGEHVLGANGEANPYKGGVDGGLIDSKYYSKETRGPVVIEREQSLHNRDNGDNVREDNAA